MNACRRGRTLGFAHHTLNKLALGWWTLTAYNWSREQRLLKLPLRTPLGRRIYQQRAP